MQLTQGSNFYIFTMHGFERHIIALMTIFARKQRQPVPSDTVSAMQLYALDLSTCQDQSCLHQRKCTAARRRMALCKVPQVKN
jgi:hypothetical protein